MVHLGKKLVNDFLIISVISKKDIFTKKTLLISISGVEKRFTPHWNLHDMKKLLFFIVIIIIIIIIITKK